MANRLICTTSAVRAKRKLALVQVDGCGEPSTAQFEDGCLRLMGQTDDWMFCHKFLAEGMVCSGSCGGSPTRKPFFVDGPLD